MTLAIFWCAVGTYSLHMVEKKNFNPWNLGSFVHLLHKNPFVWVALDFNSFWDCSQVAKFTKKPKKKEHHSQVTKDEHTWWTFLKVYRSKWKTTSNFPFVSSLQGEPNKSINHWYCPWSTTKIQKLCFWSGFCCKVCRDELWN